MMRLRSASKDMAGIFGVVDFLIVLGVHGMSISQIISGRFECSSLDLRVPARENCKLLRIKVNIILQNV